MQRQIETEVVIIGGGLAGVFAGLRLSSLGKACVLLDDPLPQSDGFLGGFARFSGAKFSLPPAGMGLLPVAGSLGRLDDAIRNTIETLGIDRNKFNSSLDYERRNSLTLRRYDSILLSPSEIRSLTKQLSLRLHQTVQVFRATALEIESTPAQCSTLIKRNGKEEVIVSDAVFFAGGRLGGDILTRAGAIPQNGKGLDLGVRIEFLDKEALSGLRALGPDAKILDKNCRTFCLNSPGTIYRYPLADISVPGGVVAEERTSSGNVGILYREKSKKDNLPIILEKCGRQHQNLIDASEALHHGAPFILPALLKSIYLEDQCEELQSFVNNLHNEGLVNLGSAYRIHVPLLDWHWNTYSLPGTHKTTNHRIFALGDSSGHARGLLQACISGWLAAEEYSC